MNYSSFYLTDVGCHIAVMDQRSLIPIKTYTIADTHMINSEYFHLTLSEGTEGIKEGLVFEGNSYTNAVSPNEFVNCKNVIETL